MPKKKQKASKKKAPAKRARPKKAPMSKAADMSRAEVSIMQKMAELDADTPRYRVLEAALAFKSSWIVLGEHLAEVLRVGLWKGWGFASFERYCADEIHVTPATAKKLVRSFQWLGAEAPEYLEPLPAPGTKRASKLEPRPDLPEVGAISVLADARRHVDDGKVAEDAYLALKQAALDGETAGALRRTLKEAIPLHLRPKAADDKVRHLRRALTAAVKVLDALIEWDSGGDAAGDDLVMQAEKLRDAIALRLPRETNEKSNDKAA